MGCYTWFARPVTDREFQLMRDYAIIQAEELLGNSEFNRKHGFYNPSMLDEIRRSVRTDLPCIGGRYHWYELGWGNGNPELDADFIPIYRQGELYADCAEFNGTCYSSLRVYRYPNKIIHNKRELRRYVRKQYFNITEEDHEKLSRFWKTYPGGIMYWA